MLRSDSKAAPRVLDVVWEGLNIIKTKPPRFIPSWIIQEDRSAFSLRRNVNLYRTEEAKEDDEVDLDGDCPMVLNC